MNIFWFEAFEDGYMLFYLNDCLTPEQLKVTEEFTLIGVTSALHIHKPTIQHESSDGETYYTVAKTSEPTIIQGSIPVPSLKSTKRKK
jgi:hypothetical protein